MPPPERAPGRRPTVSLCVIARDEAQTLGRCLVSAAPYVDEMIVVDTGSVDETVAVAQAHGAKVGHFTWIDDFAAARNAALALATGDWVLSLDADETLAPRSAAQMRRLVVAAGKRPTCYGVLIRNFTGRPGSNDPDPDPGRSDTPPTPQLNPDESIAAPREADAIRHYGGRLFSRSPGVRWVGSIHETVALLEQPMGHRLTERIAAAPAASDGPQGLHYVLTDDLVIDHYGYAVDDTARQRKTERNVALLRGALLREPEEGYYHYKLGQHLVASGDVTLAIASLNRACDLARRLVPPPRYLAGVFQSLLEAHLSAVAPVAPEARTIAGLAVRAFPNHPWLWYQAGRVHEASGEDARAVSAYTRSVALESQAAQYGLTRAATGAPLVALGRLSLARGNARDAQAHFERALAVAPANRDALLGLAEVLVALGQMSGAAAALERYLSHHAEQDGICAWQGECWLASGDVQHAYDYLSAALFRHPHFTQVRLTLGRLLRDAGEPSAALEALAALLDGDSVPRAAYDLLASILEDLGRAEEAHDARLLAQAQGPS